MKISTTAGVVLALGLLGVAAYVMLRPASVPLLGGGGGGGGGGEGMSRDAADAAGIISASGGALGQLLGGIGSLIASTGTAAGNAAGGATKAAY